MSGSFYTPSLSISFAIIYTQTKHDKLENSLSSQNKKKKTHSQYPLTSRSSLSNSINQNNTHSSLLHLPPRFPTPATTAPPSSPLDDKSDHHHHPVVVRVDCKTEKQRDRRSIEEERDRKRRERKLRAEPASSSVELRLDTAAFAAAHRGGPCSFFDNFR
ncbi:hypothetical protein HanXRQr2_Chr17g0812491 [Helianthus annuus]|uniref:Uncharacterized protein n=1 Tax=Helianthus annuus TaxID=4232 RepID=A0A251SNG3_HELAN|nr:hypothetical protein HanXRQr2_Chr17g0812491 [Helianthus annuus]KAJ0429787.1 hypothetical protein HanHA300_Chr17g0661441 [Helianthus annuus]